MKDCDTCRYGDTMFNEHPCEFCCSSDGWLNWESKEEFIKLACNSYEANQKLIASQSTQIQQLQAKLEIYQTAFSLIKCSENSDYIYNRIEEAEEELRAIENT
jgi:hypothetical protein